MESRNLIKYVYFPTASTTSNGPSLQLSNSTEGRWVHMFLEFNYTCSSSRRWGVGTQCLLAESCCLYCALTISIFPTYSISFIVETKVFSCVSSDPLPGERSLWKQGLNPYLAKKSKVLFVSKTVLSLLNSATGSQPTQSSCRKLTKMRRVYSMTLLSLSICSFVLE